MADGVKRRVAAARLAVGFVVAATIAGAALAQAGPPGPAARKAGGEQFDVGKLKIDSSEVENGSLLYRDFRKGQIPSFKMFEKLDGTFSRFKKAVNSLKYEVQNELGDVDGDISAIKGELGSYIKAADADARYIKVGNAVMGDGSVFNAIREAAGQDPVPIISVPNLINIDALPGEQQIRITNASDGNLEYSQCGGLSGGGILAPGDHISCGTGDETDVMQLIGGFGGSAVTTLNFSSLPAVQAGARQYIVAILVGM